MNLLQAVFLAVFHRQDVSVTVDARVENAVFDLKRAAEVNVATTKLLDDLLHHTAS
jgi:hypothetical protein